MKLPPLCRYCGKAIAKRTAKILFGRQNNRVDHNGYWIERTERPTTKAEAQRLFNHLEIVSIRWTGLRFAVTHYADAFRPIADAQRPWIWRA